MRFKFSQIRKHITIITGSLADGGKKKKIIAFNRGQCGEVSRQRFKNNIDLIMLLLLGRHPR